jgi:N-acetylmuramoyl-L-alanine amidase
MLCDAPGFLRAVRLSMSAALLLGTALAAPIRPVAAQSAAPPIAGTPQAAAPAVEYPGATWYAAAPTNFTAANRPVQNPIDRVVMHDIEGTAQSCLSWFSNPAAKASAHYVLGGDGRVWQMLRERDIGWHAGNWDINQRSIGIEMEGFAYRPGFYNPVQLEEAARLVREITARHAIPRDRQHIIGHFEVPHPRDPTKLGGSNGHTDPGPYWDWDSFMLLVRHDARLIGAELPAVIRPGEVLPASATFENTGDDVWPSATGEGKKLGNFAAAPVYLGSAQGQESAFWSLKGWTSPRLAASAATGDTSPGAVVRYDFELTGPRDLGEHREELRLHKVRVASQGGPLPFGPRAPLHVRVVPWVLTQAQDSLPAASSIASRPSSTQWTVALPIDGLWEVSVRAPSQARRPLSMSVAAADGVRQVVVPRPSRREKNTDGWRALGRFRFQGATLPAGASFPTGELPRSANVAVVQASPGSSFAGEVRCVGPFPEEAPVTTR